MSAALSHDLAWDIAREYRSRLQGLFGARLREVRVFGSYARGTARPESDIDVAVVVDGMTHGEKVAIFELSGEIALPRGVTLSAFAQSTAEMDRLRALEARIARDIDVEGIAI